MTILNITEAWNKIKNPQSKVAGQAFQDQGGDTILHNFNGQENRENTTWVLDVQKNYIYIHIYHNIVLNNALRHGSVKLKKVDGLIHMCIKTQKYVKTHVATILWQKRKMTRGWIYQFYYHNISCNGGYSLLGYINLIIQYLLKMNSTEPFNIINL
jgi:hypothetical protein